MTKKYDWESIEREYRAGQLSLRAIAAQHGLTEGAIRKRAKAEGWQRDLTDRVRSAVRERLVRADGTLAGTQSTPQEESEVVEAASSRGFEVVQSHRKDIQQLTALSRILAERLSEYLDGIQPSGPGVGERESPGDLLEKLTRIRSKLIPLERQAYSLDEDGAMDEPATKRDVAGALRKLNRDQREQLRSIADAVAGASGSSDS